jgi:hypothetical protein
MTNPRRKVQSTSEAWRTELARRESESFGFRRGTPPDRVLSRQANAAKSTDVGPYSVKFACGKCGDEREVQMPMQTQTQ